MQTALTNQKAEEKSFMKDLPAREDLQEENCMRQYQSRETKETKKELNKIICNRCGKEIPVGAVPSEGVFSVDYKWGYPSEKDGQRHRFDLCEECYDSLLASFKIPAETAEE